MDDEVIAHRVVAHGRVQGVFFRAATRDRARQLGVHGWVRNNPDGTVEAHLEGPADAVEDLEAWIRADGPGDAVVDHLEVDAADPVGSEGFRTR